MLARSHLQARACHRQTGRVTQAVVILAPRPQQPACRVQQLQPATPSQWAAASQQRAPQVFCHSTASDASPATTEDDVVRVACTGDIVTIHFTAKDEEGRIYESSKDTDEPISFEVGAGEIMGNKLFQGFDEAVRGLAVGQMTVLEASGGEWQRDLLFVVPKDHPEILRLEGRYKNQGGLQKDMIVELTNGSLAVVMEVAEDVVKIDANNMMAGKTLIFELEVLAINKPGTELEVGPQQPAEQGAPAQAQQQAAA